MFRKIVAGAVFAASALLVTVPAGALTAGSTVCYTADGTPVVNPPNPDDYDNCVPRPPSTGGGGGGGGPVLCTVGVHAYSYDDGLGSTGPYTIKKCTPIAPLQG